MSDFTGPTTEVSSSQQHLLALPKVRVSVTDSVDRGLTVELARGTARVGTAPGSDLRLTDPTVSRMHAEIAVSRGSLRLRDLGSTNGTYVDGLRVRDVDIGSGATIRLGNTSLRIDLGDESIEIELHPSMRLGPLVGGSIGMRRVFAIIERAAPTESTVLIEGETGTGKELVARAIHDRSARSKGPFVAVDCGAIPESLSESELFGHMKGAFTNAMSERKGVFEEAQGGSLFLDEVGELSLSLQRKLLRVLESREVRRVGASGCVPIDVRVIAATNRPLARAVNEGLFRDDLYYRLAVVAIELPPLRTRREDIPLLAQHLFQRLTGTSQTLPPHLVASLIGRAWPGNGRELRNHIERMISLGLIEGCQSPSAGADTGPLPSAVEALVPVHLPFREAREAWVDRFESAYVRAILSRTSGNVTRAAELGGVSRRFLQRLMIRAGLRDDPSSGV